MTGMIQGEAVRSNYKLKINSTGVSHVLKYHTIGDLTIAKSLWQVYLNFSSSFSILTF